MLEVKVALENIILHAFGHHRHCTSFCTQKEDGTYKYKYFEDKKWLTDMNLINKLETIL